MAKAKTKTAAMAVIVQTRDEAVESIKRLGDLMREKERIQAKLNDHVAELQKQADEDVAPLLAEMESLEQFIEVLCNSGQLDFSYAGTVSTNTYGAYELYNANTDKMYVITYDMYKSFVSREVVKLQGYKYNKSDYKYSDIYEYLN